MATITNMEPNGLYPPSDAAATLIQCVGDNGEISIVYWEWYVAAFQHRVKSDRQLEMIYDEVEGP
jgi:hypothetical protein